jgi:lipase maturation factor
MMPSMARARSSYWLTRFVILRLLGFVYLAAFLSAALQVVPLIGHDGLLPADTFLGRVVDQLGSPWQGFLRLPSLFWLGVSDAALRNLAWVGVGLAFVVLCGYANALIMAALWALYFSFVSVGQDWYGYGWEIQLLETGAVAVFLCPLFDGRPFPRRPPPFLAILLMRWLALRIMLGAGLIKMRGDPCWRELTCLVHHYETQPIPNPISRFYHFMPLWFHKGGALYNHLSELVSPCFVFGPRIARRVAGVLMVIFQCILISSGNLSFLNYLTIVPILATLDDGLLRRILPGWLTRRADRAAAEAPPAAFAWPAAGSPAAATLASAAPIAPAPGPVPEPAPSPWPERARLIPVALYTALVAVLSINPVVNMLSPGQIMNTSFDRLNLVNTYGAFGSVGQVRHEIVFEGTRDDPPTAATEWKEYDFWCKPGTPTRRPCVIAPLQPRLDWQIWFAAMSRPDRYPWTLHLVWKLLHNDPGTLSLLGPNPFPDAPPLYVRAAYYRYEFAPPGNPDGAWWNRTYLGEWLPPLGASDPRLLRILEAYGWIEGSSPPS